MVLNQASHVAMVAAMTAMVAIGADARGQTADLSKHIVQKTTISRGLCCLPRCGDGRLAVAFARSGFVVHAMDADPAKVDAARQLAASRQLLGQSLYVDEGSPAAIPIADDYVNLLAVADATDQNLASLPPGEIVRVLVPETGVAMVGHGKSAPGQLTRGKLVEWLDGFAGARTEVFEDEQGLWAIASKPPKRGAVAWTHRLFSPANNPVSTDTACAWPLMTQWLGKPYLAQLPLVLVAQGKLAGVRVLGGGNPAVLEVRDAHNGLLLWRRPLPDASVATRTSGMVLLAGALYLAEGPNVLVFDPATGKETARVDCAELGGQVKWLAVQDAVLYAMAGSAERPALASQTWKVFGNPPAGFARCGGMGAYDLSRAKWLWTHREDEQLLDEGYVGLCAGRWYYYVSGRHMACREARTGRVVWENAKPAEKVGQFGNGDFRGHIGALVCTEKVLALHKPGRGSLVLSASDGEPLWSLMATSLLFRQDLLLRKGGSNWGRPAAFDAATGQPSEAMAKISFGGGCGAFTLTPNLLCGQLGLTYDFRADKALDAATGYGPLMHKTPCVAGSFVAEGLLVFGSVSCTCPYTVRGTVVQAPAPTVPKVAKDGSRQLRRAPGSLRVEPLAADAADWPTFRAGPERGNASRAKVPAKAAVKWTWRPGPRIAEPASEDAAALPAGLDPLQSDREPVQATAVGGLVFAAAADGVVTALDLATGAVRWQFVTGARLFAPPTVAEGRCLIGSGDGSIYCLEARTGRELWRYRVAPLDRRIMVYGDLLSTWPITGGVLVEGGVAYAVAGMLDVDGTYAVALDAATGQLKWCNDTSGHLDAYRRTGVAGMGYPAIAKGRLWLRRDSYDLATGECRPSAGLKKPRFEMANNVTERYTGMFAGRFLVTGGRRFFDEQFAVHEERGHGVVQLLELAEDGTGKLPAIAPWQRCRTMPAWDDQDMVALPMDHYQWSADGKTPPYVREEDLVCWNAARTAEELHKAIGESPRAPGLANPLGYRLYFKDRVLEGKDLDKVKGETFRAPQQVWAAQKTRYIAAVLASGAVVAAHGSPAIPGKPARGKTKPEEPAYGLVAYGRGDGKVLWEATLPGEPLMDGLSIARDGTVLVRLLDGALVAVGSEGK